MLLTTALSLLLVSAPADGTAIEPQAPQVSGIGGLLVYTDKVPAHGDDIPRSKHRPYDVFTSDGQLVQRVSNQKCFTDELPTFVRLQPGSYKLEIETRDGLVDVSVSVAAGKTTRVDTRDLNGQSR